MIIHDAIQGSPEWHALRLGVLTASRAKDLLTPAKLDLSKQRGKLMDALLHEQFTGSSAEGFGGSAWTEHGHAVEPEACAYFAMETGLNALPVGFVTDADRPGIGCSPDALIRDSGGDLVAGLELKAPAGWTHIGYLRAGIVPPEYMMQIQFSLWVTGLPLWYFMSYGASPYGGDWLPTWQPGAYLPPLLLEVEPEDRYQDAFAEHVPAFVGELESARAALIDAGAKLPNER